MKMGESRKEFTPIAENKALIDTGKIELDKKIRPGLKLISSEKSQG